MLKAAFNSLTRLHSRSATLKRLGTPDIYSPIRITPANYFRFLRGPEYTTVKGVEFIIPKDTALGQHAQKLTINKVPDDGDFKLTFGGQDTTTLESDVVASEIQIAVRLLTGFEDTLVTGDWTVGFTFTFQGISATPAIGVVTDSTLSNLLDDALVTTWTSFSILWSTPIKKGDRIVDGSSLWTIAEIIDMHDVGAIVMGWRVRCD